MNAGNISRKNRGRKYELFLKVINPSEKSFVMQNKRMLF
jgi:hypothetical protein